MTTFNIRKLSKSIALSLILFGTIASTTRGDTMNSNDLILIPEPTLGRFIFGGYTLDKEATITHYNNLFEGKTAEEVVRFLEERDKHIFYYSNENKMGILIERLVTFFYYSAKINFFFEDGIFQEATIAYKGVK